MKVNKSKIIYLLLAFIISITFITWGLSQLELKNNPQVREALAKSKISQVEYIFAVCGKQLPDSKVKVFNSMVKKSSQFDYSKNNFEDYAENWLIFLIPSLILTAILFAPYLIIQDRIERKKKIKQEALLKENYIKKYSLNGKVTKVKCIDGTISNTQVINKTLNFWNDKKAIYFVNSDHHNDLGLFNIQFKDVIWFSRYGELYTSMDVNGGDSSFGRAALGYLIAGPAGAIIASVDSINSETIVHDKRETLLFIQENNEEKYIFFEPNLYDVLMHILPSKEINIMAKKEKKYEGNNDKFEKIKKLGELREKGYIDESEFIKLKADII
ncbi:SHOCT domain-containing protein [Clostridium sp. FP1]|uniref:SHOCT domain-containing protein n=1 Tax=Clostridium sp. FP1 TaxID=2724076 RepID=UPI0013E97E43|nr:SHOCT domain-containing protein [Clostridium sp. FP1]MBZ9633218.1 SHOCT domain-containing protein [Clostridium sp. FP1]